MDDDDGEQPLQPSLDRPQPEDFPDSFWPLPPPPTPLPRPHLDPYNISTNYFKEDDDNDGGCMLGEFPWSLSSADDSECRFRALDRIGEGCSASMLSSFPSTSVSIGDAMEGLLDEVPDVEESDDKLSSLEIA